MFFSFVQSLSEVLFNTETNMTEETQLPSTPPGLGMLIRGVSYNMELNVLRVVICSRKSEVSVERILVYNVTEKYAEHGIHYMTFSKTDDVKGPSP